MAGSFTTAFPTSFKGELPQAIHNFTAAQHVFKCALGKSASALTGSYGAATTNYSTLTGNTDELANGSGYATGGVTLTTNITPLTSGTGAYWQWTSGSNPQWTSATFTTNGCLIYNSSASNKCVYVGGFGGDQPVVGGTFTLIQPSNAVNTSLLQLN